MQYRFIEEIFERTGLTFVHKAFGGLVNVAKEAIKTHMEEFDDTAKPADFIEAYLARMRAETDTGSSFYGKVGELNLISDVVDLFFAGAETTTSTLNWTLYFMVKYPDVQKRVQEELDSVIGRNRSPTLSDRDMTPYTEAVLLEVQRRGNVLPLAVPHASSQTRTSKIGEFDIPPNTDVMLCIGEVYNDPEVFENPDQFDPERYLVDGKFRAHPKVIPFGIGKRRCLGEVLAKAQLYLYFARIMQVYDVQARSEIVEGTDDGFVVSPKMFQVAFVPRK